MKRPRKHYVTVTPSLVTPFVANEPASENGAPSAGKYWQWQLGGAHTELSLDTEFLLATEFSLDTGDRSLTFPLFIGLLSFADSWILFNVKN